MTQLATLTLRRDEFARRVDALPKEVAAWKARTSGDLADLDAHFSQLEALEIFMGALVDRQQQLLAALDPSGDVESFRTGAFALVQDVIKTQRIWDFFRDKLELRFSPDFKDVLWTADTIAWDCYRPVMDRAVNAGIVPVAEVREPPLTYLTAEFSPATWVRGSRPNDGRNYELGTSTLPIPVIEVPWDHLGNLWELVALQHEVGHDIEADLKLRPNLLASLQSTLADAGVPQERIKTWVAWEGEIFADLVGMQLGGPAFTRGLMHLILLPAAMVTTYDADDPHPTHFVRVLMNAAYIRTLVDENQRLADDADAIEFIWKDLYGDVPAFAPFEDDFQHVFRALMDTNLEALGNGRIRELMPFTAADDTRIRSAAAYLKTGLNAPGPLSMPARHAASAARLAAAEVVEEAVAGGAPDDGQIAGLLGSINERLVELVKDQAAPGLRAGDMSDRHKRFVAGFADLV